jgi:hypothetical protein
MKSSQILETIFVVTVAVALTACLLWLFDAEAAEPEEVVVEAKRMPPEWPPCKWLNEKTCLTPAQWEQAVDVPAGKVGQ